MLKSFFCSKEWALWAWGGLFLLCTMIGLEVWVNVWINGWYRETWDFLQNPNPLLKDAISNADTNWHAKLAEIDPISNTSTLYGLAEFNINRFWGYILEFCVIVFPYVIVRVLSSFFAQHYAFRWRQAITFSYIPFWAKVETEVEGASQRLQEDPQKFALLVERLGLGLFRAVLTLIAFVPILWAVSAEISDHFSKAVGLKTSGLDLPFLSWTANTVGSLMWIAIALSLGGTIISYFVGIRLPGLEYNNQKVEAKFRKQLVLAEDDKTFADFPTIVELFTGLRLNYFRLYAHYSYFGVWANLFSQFIVVVDLMLIGTGIVLGIITLGFLNQISHAFSKVTDSLKFFVDNWTTVTELMSIVKRLREFELNIGYNKAPKPIDSEPTA